MKASNRQIVVLVKVALLVGTVLLETHIVPAPHVEQTRALAQAGTPNPHIDYIHLNGSSASSVTITRGNSVTIEVQATNTGSVTGYRGGIYISFAGFDSYSVGDYVTLANLWTSNGDVNLEYLENRPADPNNPIWYACEGRYGVARNLRVAGYAPSEWMPGEQIHLEVKVTPPGPGLYQVYVRSVVAGTDSGGPYYYDPAGGAVVDQQCMNAYRRTIMVDPQVLYLPVVLKNLSSHEGSRSVWMQASSCYSASRCDQRLDCIQAAGATRLYYTIYGQKVYYHSNLMPHRGFDSLAYVVSAAHARGMEVYAAMPSGRMGWPQHPEWNARLNHPNVTTDWLDFAHPDARDFLADVAEEIVANYDVDGIALDYTRWRREWYRQAGLSADDISLTVRGIYERIKSVRSVDLAATPDGSSEFSTYSYGQRWYDWLDGGYIDHVSPMSYHPDDWLLDRMDEWRSSGHFPGRITPLLSTLWFDWNPGHSVMESKTPEEVMHQIDLCYNAGSIGVTLFDDIRLCQDPRLVKALGAGGW